MKMSIIILVLIAVSCSLLVYPASAGPKLDINKATANQFTRLKGIGPAKAAKIVEYRKSNGPFKSIEEILDVPGIGQKTFEKFKDSLTVRNNGNKPVDLIALRKRLNRNNTLKTKSATSMRLDINRVGVEELKQLKGIGRAKATKIVEYRKSKGSFRSIEEIMNVPGIGPKTFVNLKNEITVTNGTYNIDHLRQRRKNNRKP